MMMKAQPYIYFHTSLANHRYYDEHIGFPKIEPQLWDSWAFGNYGVYFVPADLRGYPNPGAAMFAHAVRQVRAEYWAWANTTKTLQ